ncbi:metal-dependent hydrolase family protein [Sphingomonas sp. YL-JM2C]
MSAILHNGPIFDGHSADLLQGQAIYVEDGLIREIAPLDKLPGAERRIDLNGHFVMPGLIDAHFHAYGIEVDLEKVDHISPALRSLHARRFLEGALHRGFTTVRDAAGGDLPLATALEQGLIDGPRFFFPGLAISQTGGHGDFRLPDHYDACACAYCGALATVADGPDEVRRVVRDQLRKGAHHIKLFVSGGVLSRTDPIWMRQFSDAEIRVAVEEAETRRAYVMAHVHTNEATLRCVANGVRSLEHVTILERDGADAIVAAGAFAVPTFAIGDAMKERAEQMGLPAAILDKVRAMGDVAYASLDHLRQAGAQIGFGTDLLGPLMDRQAREFRLRLPVCSPVEILRSATSVNAALLQMEGKLGTIAPGACADIIAIDGNPLDDIALFEQQERIGFIMRDGKVVRCAL